LITGGVGLKRGYWLAKRIVRYAPGAAAAFALAAVNNAGTTVAPDNWPAYLGGSLHSSYNRSEKMITPANASRLVLDWHFVGARGRLRGQPAPGFVASPTVYGGAVYIGSQTGWFYKLNAQTGTVMAKRYIGFVPGRTCGLGGAGFADTATVAIDKATRKLMVYVAGADEVMFAMYASNLAVRWRSVVAIPSKVVANYYQWASPTVAHGVIYVGISSHCDKPLVPGGLISFNQATGARIARFYSLPRPLVGGSVWSSAAVGSAGLVYVSTGNPQRGLADPAHSDAIVQLAPRTLRALASFQVPRSQVVPDGDFGASPTLFGRFVGACNKNGIFYALTRHKLRLAWWKRVGAAVGPGVGFGRCASAAVYDGKHLYIGTDQVHVRGKTYLGSLTELNPNTGYRTWVTGLPNGVIGTPSLDGAGVIAVGTYDFSSTPNAVYLVSAATGRILRTLTTGGYDFAQSVFAGGRLFTANDTGLYAWGLPAKVR
jgi:outer membrane protein assembly factor BamB